MRIKIYESYLASLSIRGEGKLGNGLLCLSLSTATRLRTLYHQACYVRTVVSKCIIQDLAHQ